METNILDLGQKLFALKFCKLNHGSKPVNLTVTSIIQRLVIPQTLSHSLHTTSINSFIPRHTVYIQRPSINTPIPSQKGFNTQRPLKSTLLTYLTYASSLLVGT